MVYDFNYGVTLQSLAPSLRALFETMLEPDFMCHYLLTQGGHNYNPIAYVVPLLKPDTEDLVEQTKHLKDVFFTAGAFEKAFDVLPFTNLAGLDVDSDPIEVGDMLWIIHDEVKDENFVRYFTDPSLKPQRDNLKGALLPNVRQVFERLEQLNGDLNTLIAEIHM